eukprot:GHVN01024733.1.p1 GENE.GHVN01024733.1~~GHVN01024733.1.p1  ORF type:complete len:971 (+),score=165.12 GHVN01024733.1:59-2971(+)
MGNSDSRVAFREQFDSLVAESAGPTSPEEGDPSEGDPSDKEATKRHSLSFIKDGDSFWKPFFSSNLTADDIFELVLPEDIRTIKANKPFILSIMLKKIVGEFKEALEEGNTTGKLSNPATIIKLKTCLLILTRLMPVLLENPTDEFVSILFWTRGGYVSPVQREFQRQVSHDNGVVRAVTQADDGMTTQASSNKSDQSTPADEDLTRRGGGGGKMANELAEDNFILGTEILSCLQRLLFLNGFCVNAPGVTISAQEHLPKHKVDTRFIWKGGIGTAKELPTNAPSAQMIEHRVIVLRCLVVCLCGSLYQTMDEYARVAPTWLKVLTHGDLPYTANLFCSLMSTVFTHDPVGYGVPYGSMLRSNPMDELVRACLQLLCVVTDFNVSVFLTAASGGASPTVNPDREGDGKQGSDSEPSRDMSDSRDGISTASKAATASATSSARNVYRTMLGGIKKDNEILLIYTGTVNLLATITEANNTLLPMSASPIQYHQELLILFWHLLTSNPKLLNRLTARHNSNRLAVPLLFLLLDCSNARKDGAAKVGLLHMCCFILLVLSSEREFAVRLNEPYLDSFPLELPPFNGCHGDVFMLVVYKVVIASTGPISANDSLIDMLLTVMCNMSAYIKSFCPESCMRIVQLVDRFTRSAWLLKAPYHYHDVLFLLDMINNLIQYQYEGNKRLVYSILRSKETFLRLPNLTFPDDLTHPGGLSRASSGGAATTDTGGSPLTSPTTGPGHPITSSGGGGTGSGIDNGLGTGGTQNISVVNAAAPRIATTQRHGVVSDELDEGGERDEMNEVKGGESAYAHIGSRGSESGSVVVSPYSVAGSTGPHSSPGVHQVSKGGEGVQLGGSSEVGDGSGEWVPTRFWFEDWKSKLPLQTVLRLIHCLLPLVEEECQEKALTDQEEVMEFLNRTTMVGLLPVPHPIIIRNYQQNAYTALWFTSYMWGVIFTKVQTLSLFDWTKIRLISINNR